MTIKVGLKSMVVAAVALSLIVAGGPVLAVDESTESPDGKEVPTIERIDQIKSVCKSVQTTINQIHVNDALARVNLGREYEDFSSKLLEPFNARVELNKLDHADLKNVTDKYNRHLSAFREAYRNYDNTMTDIINIDCTANTEKFYDLIIKARSERMKVGQQTLLLSQDASQYKDAFIKFRKGLANEKQ